MASCTAIVPRPSQNPINKGGMIIHLQFTSKIKDGSIFLPAVSQHCESTSIWVSLTLSKIDKVKLSALKSSRCITCRHYDECQGSALHCGSYQANDNSEQYGR